MLDTEAPVWLQEALSQLQPFEIASTGLFIIVLKIYFYYFNCVCIHVCGGGVTSTHVQMPTEVRGVRPPGAEVTGSC